MRFVKLALCIRVAPLPSFAGKQRKNSLRLQTLGSALAGLVAQRAERGCAAGSVTFSREPVVYEYVDYGKR